MSLSHSYSVSASSSEPSRLLVPPDNSPCISRGKPNITQPRSQEDQVIGRTPPQSANKVTTESSPSIASAVGADVGLEAVRVGQDSSMIASSTDGDSVTHPRHEAGLLYGCDKCAKSYTWEKSLARHKKMAHRSRRSAKSVLAAPI